MTEQAQAPVFAIQRMYLKDLSLEIPHAPQIFLETQQPTVEIGLDVSGQQITEGIYETTVTLTVTTKSGEKVAFLVEAKQAGIFEIRNVPAEQMPLIMNIVCPNIIYPYLRSNVADAVQRTGFPPIHLAEINFEALYQQRLAQQQAQQGGQEGRPEGEAAQQVVGQQAGQPQQGQSAQAGKPAQQGQASGANGPSQQNGSRIIVPGAR